jgi:hypothetical protein
MRYRWLTACLRRRLLTTIPLIALLLWPAPAALGEEPYAAASRKALIASNIQLALAPARLGLNLLQTGRSPEEFARASDAIYTSYKHLRLAQETSENLLGESKFPDPLTKLRNARIQKIRDSLRYCRDNDGALINQNAEFTADCLRRLVDAVHLLEIVVTTDN